MEVGMFGTVRQLADGRVELRFERWFPHSPDRVWRALTSVAELRTWFVFTNTVADGGIAAAVDPGWDLGLKRLADALDL